MSVISCLSLSAGHVRVHWLKVSEILCASVRKEEDRESDQNR